jgi:phosphatidylserine synthase
MESHLEMSMPEPPHNIVFKNLANIVSFLGILPICILFGENGFQYLFPFIIYNNAMDDLDGVLAAKLDIRSKFGGRLDNVCDAIAHTVIVIVVATHMVQAAASPWIGWVCLAASLLATTAIIVRVVIRIDPTFVEGNGSPTNELIRHVFFVLLIAQIFELEPTLFLIITFIFHAVSMLAPFRLPFMIRSMTKSAFSIGMVNVALLLAWLVPYATPFVAGAFIIAYMVSFAAGGFRWFRSVRA